MQKPPLGAKISLLSSLVILVAFFLPWVSILCYGSLVVTVKGYEIAAGIGERIDLPSQVTQGKPVLYLLPISAFVVVLVAIIASVRGRFGVTHALTQGGVSLLGLLVFGLVIAQMQFDLKGGEGWAEYEVQTHPGFWMTLLGLLGMISGAVLSMLRVRGSGEDDFDEYGYSSDAYYE